MKYPNYLLAFIATFSFTLLTEAKEIYESKGKKGGVEFTDQPSPGAEVVNIQEPNIADAVDSPKPTQDKPEIKKTTKQKAPAEPEVIHRDVADDDKNPKRVHREQQRQKRKYERQDNRKNPKKSAGHSAVKGR